MIRWQPTRADTASARRRRLLLSLMIKAGIAAILVSAFIHPRPVLVYNPSPSVPIGFYLLAAPEALVRGDLVLAPLPDPIHTWADKRGYVPATVPVLKQVAALAGDEVCATGPTVRINGQTVATRLRSDRAGRGLPWWEGCRRLTSGEVFLFNAASHQSFDGRYFGVTKRTAIIGKAHRL